MKTIILICFASFLAGFMYEASADTDETTIRELFEKCTTDQVGCRAYYFGTLIGVRVGELKYGKNFVCIPAGMTNVMASVAMAEATADLGTKMLKNDPENPLLDRNGADLAVESLMGSFPCK